jgi:hypothetical protein
VKLENEEAKRRKAYMKQFRDKVPPLLQCYSDHDIERYENVLVKDTQFLLKTVTVCLDCFLKCTEFNELAGAIGQGYGYLSKYAKQKHGIAHIQK